MKNILLLTLLMISCYSIQIKAQEKITAADIIKMADEKVRGKTNTSVMEMEIIRPTWKRSVTMKSWGRGMEYSMTYITAPAKDKGQDQGDHGRQHEHHKCFCCKHDTEGQERINAE